MPKEEKFLVHPDALRGYAALLERQLGYLREMQSHSTWTAETRGLQGIMVRWHNQADELYRWQSDKLADMVTKLGATVQGLRATADAYQNTDVTQAEEFDKKVPTAPETNPGAGRGER